MRIGFDFSVEKCYNIRHEQMAGALDASASVAFSIGQDPCADCSIGLLRRARYVTVLLPCLYGSVLS